jgi:hypothetical protein
MTIAILLTIVAGGCFIAENRVEIDMILKKLLKEEEKLIFKVKNSKQSCIDEENKDIRDYNLILLTGTIDPMFFSDKNADKSINVVLSDATERLNQYCEVIRKFISESPFDRIVFAENTNHPFDTQMFIQLADNHGKKFEFIRCVLNETEKGIMRKKGKSYGEGKLISYAVKNSRLIAEVDVIYKITGRVFLNNGASILKSKHKVKNEFISKNKIGWSNTEFFKINKQDFIKYFYGVEDFADDYAERSIERVYYRILRENKVDVKAFRAYPVLHGRVASTVSRFYDKTKLQLAICEILSYIGYYDIN